MTGGPSTRMSTCRKTEISFTSGGIQPSRHLYLIPNTTICTTSKHQFVLPSIHPFKFRRSTTRRRRGHPHHGTALNTQRCPFATPEMVRRTSRILPWPPRGRVCSPSQFEGTFCIDTSRSTSSPGPEMTAKNHWSLSYTYIAAPSVGR